MSKLKVAPRKGEQKREGQQHIQPHCNLKIFKPLAIINI